MARERELIEEIRQSERPQYEITQSTHADVIVDTAVEFLREVFANHPIYPYISRPDSFGPDFERTKIVIVDKYEEEAIFLPTITVSIDNINTRWVQFSQSPFKTVLKPMMNPDGSIMRDTLGKAVPSHYEYPGAYDGSVSFIVSANDTLEREELVNLLHVVFAESGRDTLYMRGIFVKNVTTGGQSEEEYRNDWIFKQAVTIETYSEWRRKIPVGETLESIGYKMNIVEEFEPVDAPVETVVPGTPLNIYNLDTQPFIIDDATGQPVRVDFKLDAQSVAAPITIIYDATAGDWVPSPFWIKVMEDTLIPWQNLEMDINKENPSVLYFKEAAEAIMQAQTARALASTQGRKIADGTVILNGTFIYTDGRVDLRNFSVAEPLIYSAMVFADNTVVFRQTPTNKDENILVIKDLVFDMDGNVVSGSIYKRLGNVDTLLISTGDVLLDGYGYTQVGVQPGMSAVDLFMIMQFGQQPYRFTLSQITEQIDNVLTQLGNMLLPITFRMAKLTSLITLKEDLINRSERFLLEHPVGL